MNKEIRTDKTQRKLEEYYRKYPNVCFICQRKPKQKFKFWKIISNFFPYDKIATKHDMLVPLRHISLESKFSQGEKKNCWRSRKIICPVGITIG